MNVMAICDSAGIVINPDNTVSCSTGWSFPPEPIYSALEVFNLSDTDLAILMGSSMALFIGAFALKQTYKFIAGAVHGSGSV